MCIRFFWLLQVLFIFSHVVGAAQLILTPFDTCGIFKTVDGTWSSLPPADITVTGSRQGLTVHGVLRKPSGETFISKGENNDDLSIFTGDVFEFQISPPNDENNYFHFALSPSRYLYSAKKRDISWNPKDMTWTSKVSGNQWEFTMFVPYADIETSAPQIGDKWRINLARTNIDAQGNVECSSHSGARNFHDIFQYSTVVFSKPDAVKPPLLHHVSRDEKSVKYTFRRISAPADIIAEFSSGDISVSKPLILKNGDFSVTVPLDGYIPPKGSRRFSVILKNKVTGKVDFFDTAYLPVLRHRDLLVPDSFYYIAGYGGIGVRQHFGEKAVLTLKKDDVCVMRIENAGTDEKIPLKDLSPGRYVLELHNGKFRTSRVIIILPEKPELQPIPVKASLKIVDGKYIELAGKPTFFWGVSASPKYFFRFKPATNLLFVPEGGQLNGVKNPGMPPWAKLHRKPKTSYEYPDMETSLQIVREYASAIDTEAPALHRMRYEASLPWLIIDPNGTKRLADTAARFAKLYAEVKKVNPAILCTLHIDNPYRINDYARSCDVFEYASYTSSYAKNMMNNLPADIDSLTNVVRRKPIIYWLGGTIPDNYCRIAEELRCAAYYCVMHGIVGNIIHLGHGYLPEERGRMWSLISGILAEIQSFYADFITGTDISAELKNESSAEIHCKAIRTKKGDIIIIAINTSPVEVAFRCTLNEKVYARLLTPFEPCVFTVRTKDD